MSAPTLAYDRRGSGEPLVLMHPLGADRGVWAPVMELLSVQRDVIAVDLPGFGESPDLPEDVPATPAALGAAVGELLDAFAVSRAHVAGISLGAWAGLELARTGRALSVTALCPAGFWPRPLGPRPEVTRRSANVLRPLFPLLLSTRAGRVAALRGVMAHPERVPRADALRLVRAYAGATGFQRANAEMRGSVFAGFDDIEAPVTVAWAERDRLVRPPRGGLPEGVHRAFLAGCGHVPTWDDPALVARTILEAGARDAPARSELSA